MPVSVGPQTASNTGSGTATARARDIVSDWSEALQNWERVITDPHEASVFRALDNPNWDWRTVEGIRRETGLEIDEIQQILGKYAALIRADRSGEHGPVYQLRNRTTKTESPLLDKALDYLSMGKRRKIA